MSKAGSDFARIIYFLVSPALFFYFRFGPPRTRVLVVVDKKALLVKNRFGANEWGLPGGGLHRGELPSVGAARELQEEVGIQIPASRLRQILDEPLGIGRGLLTYRGILFVTKLKEQPRVVLQQREILAAKWVALDDLATPEYEKVSTMMQAFGGLASLVE
ncbi:MAG TPA: NUDIX hydrolase [Candidatus Saccharibacteria bacterium]|nr:NUDIX hydrolase [Candidatus Saccharibacteria bacterium]